MKKYLALGVITASAFLGFSASAFAVNLPQLNSSEWDTYTGDNTRFDGIYWRTGSCKETVDERSKTPAAIAELYTRLSNEIFGRRVAMTAGYAYDTSYACDQGGRWHAAIDMSASNGTSLKTVIGGTTTMIQNQKGNYFLGINGDDGNLWIYGHLGTLSVDTKNVRVNAGTTIGTIGSANHLHLEVQNGHSYKQTQGASSKRQFVLDNTISPLQAYFNIRGTITLPPPRFVTPTPPNGAICENPFSARTASSGVNVRSGPGTNFSIVRRIGGNQTVTFDCWMHGTAERDIWTGVRDARWYRIAGTNQWISSAVVIGNAPGSRPLP